MFESLSRKLEEVLIGLLKNRYQLDHDNGRRVVEFCAERVPFVGNTYFKHRNLYKYTRTVGGRDGVEIKSMIDLMLVKRNMLRYVQDGMQPLRPSCCNV